MKVAQRCRAQAIKKPGQEFLELAKIALEIERYRVDLPLKSRRHLRRHRVAADQAVQMPLCLDPKMSHNHVDVVALGKRTPVDLIVAQIAERVLQLIPGPLIHLGNNPQGFVHYVLPPFLAVAASEPATTSAIARMRLMSLCYPGRVRHAESRTAKLYARDHRRSIASD